MQYRFVMFQTHAVSPITFRFHISVQAKLIQTSSCSEKSGKTGKNAPSVTSGQRAVTLCAGVRQIFIAVLFTSKDFTATVFMVGEKAMSYQTQNQTTEIKEAIHIILTFSL